MRGCQESGSSEDIDRADVLMVSQGSLRRADNPPPELVLTIWTQRVISCDWLMNQSI